MEISCPGSLHPASATGVIVLARSVFLCVSRSHRWTDKHTDLNFGMEVKWKDQGHRSRSPSQKTFFFFNEMYHSDTAAIRKRLMQMKPGFLLSACRIALYVEFNFMYECWGYGAGCFQSGCIFFIIKPCLDLYHLQTPYKSPQILQFIGFIPPRSYL